MEEIVDNLRDRVEALENKKSWTVSYDAIICLLAIQLVTLKLTDVIDWPWFFVLSPLYLPITIAFLIGVFYIAHGSIKVIKEGRKE